MKKALRKSLILVIALTIAFSSTVPVAAATKTVALKSIAVSAKTATINVGGTKKLTVTYNPTNTTANKTVTWKTSNAAVATVSKGTITAKKPGTATITATCGKATATCKVTVKAPLTKIALNKTSANVVVGKAEPLKVTYTPANTTDSKTVKWTSSNTAVATVSGGKVTAKKEGTATITATCGNKKATCSIVVTKKAVPTDSQVTVINTAACYTKINDYRKAAKVATLKKDATLEKYAKIRARELVVNFSHTRPGYGTKGLSIIPGNVYKGENVAMGQPTCDRVMAAWYASSGHKANMLNKNYKKVGIVGIKYNGKCYWVQLFSS